ncbi:hypothetical protein lerEdw1_009411 [Lerista edwardsae]|nr:hypothetical protein lerEdw1_009411 [Lerista edwardsae]
MFHPLQWRPPSSVYAYYVNAARIIGHEGKLNLCQGEKSCKGRLQWLLTWLQKGSKKCPRQKSLLSVLANQCSYVTGQRVWRAQQIGQLYSNIYSERTRKSLFSSLWRKFQRRHANACKLMAALTGVFLWEEERIKEEELRSPEEQSWELVMDKKHFKLWRRPIGGTPLYQYRVFGTYTDVTPRQFFNVQLDTEYRKKWDSLVIKLEVIERDQDTGSEVVHWVTQFPYPMYSRDYVYVRRYNVDPESNLMVLVSRAVEHPRVPEDPEFVRVRNYESQMVIRPHTSFDENGFDYLLTYSDNPQTVFPRYCVSWMVSSGMPDFLEKLHTAALKATNMEVKVHDYISFVRPMESAESSSSTAASTSPSSGPSTSPSPSPSPDAGKASTVSSQEHKSDGTCTPIQIDFA